MTSRAPSSSARVLRRIAIGLIVLIVLVVAADRIGDYVAEQTAASNLQDSQNLPHEPDVDIHGVPFLTQLVSGDYDEIEVSASDVPIGTDTVSLDLSKLHVVLNHVTVSHDFSTFHADSASARGTVSFGELSNTLGVDVSYAGDGRVKATKKISLLGQTITPTVTAAPLLVNGALSFGAAQVNGAGALGGQVSQVLDKVFDIKAPLQGIPFQVRVQKLSVDGDGLEIDLAGADLSYHQ